MTPHLEDLLGRVHQHGGRLEPRGGKLRIEAPAPLPEDLVEDLRQHKPELMRLLRESEPARSQVPLPERLGSMPLADFMDSNLVATLSPSGVLGDEPVILAGRRARLTPEEHHYAYQGAELELLLALNPSPDDLRRMHTVKKVFGGTFTEALQRAAEQKVTG